MAMIPILHCTSMSEAVAFYTRVLDFEHLGSWPADGDPRYVILEREGDELHLSTLKGDGAGPQTVGVLTRDVEAVFAAFRSRGLDTSRKPDSPVHQGPVDQTWGTRELYVDDPSGNTLRFMQR